MAGDEKIRVTGLKELRRELKRADPALPKELQKTNKAVAERIVGPARARMAGHSPRAGSRAAGTIRALASGTRAQVAVGTAGVPWALGHEFGATRYRQFPPHLGRTGYGVYPTIRDQRQQINDSYLEMLDQLLEGAFPD